jgi:nicotinate-nucleotide pyrophosphorylase (carboxylating)
MLPKEIDSFIKAALFEDIGSGDLTTLSTIPEGTMGEATFWVKEPCVLGGIELAELICAEVDPQLSCTFDYLDGQEATKNQAIGKLSGPIHAILKAERLLLNCMQRMSAIATKTHRLVQVVRPYGCKILDTRKTTPNFRICEKWAVKIGGGENHRFGLYDEILIKDNHVAVAGGIENALKSCKNYLNIHSIQCPVVVEVKTTQEFEIARSFPFVSRILLDNFSPEGLEEALKLNKNPRISTEASGGINELNLLEYAKSGVDYVSIGDLTHHIQSVDMSLKISNYVI